MGILKGRAGFLNRSQDTLAEMKRLGQSATQGGLQTLGKLAGTPVKTHDPRVAIVPREQAAAVLNHHAKSQIAARFPFGGTAPGTALTFFQKADALKLVELLMGRDPGTIKRMGDLESSAIAEMTNIALNGCINQIAAAEGVRFSTGVPETVNKIPDLDLFLSFDGGPEYDHVLLVETPFIEPTRQVHGTMVLVFGVKGSG